MTRLALLLAASTLAASPLAAQSFSVPRLSQDIKTLSSDAYEGRGPATPGEAKTVAYLTQQLKAAKVQPGGDVVDGQRQYTQRVPLLQSSWSADPVVTLSLINRSAVAGIAGGAVAGRLAQGTDIAVRAPLNGASQLQLANAPLVFAGYGVQAPERQWDDFKGMDVRGKILVVFINDPDFDGPLGRWRPRLRRQGDDLLRPLDLQIRTGRQARRRRRPDRPRGRARLLRLGDGQEFEHQHHVRRRPPEPRRRRTRRWKAGSPPRPRRRSSPLRA